MPRVSLFNVAHPFHGPEGNFYAPAAFQAESYQHFDSWAEFRAAEEASDMDPYLNMLYRWDILTDPDTDDHLLRLHYVQQARGSFLLFEVDVTHDDEPAMRLWLEPHARMIVDIWSPLLDNTTPDL